VIFELQFGTHNRIIHLLYGILLQEPGSLTKQLRSFLRELNFHIDKKEPKRNTKKATTMSTTMSTTNKTPSPSMDDLTCDDDSQVDNLTDHQVLDDFHGNTLDKDSSSEEEYGLSVFELLANASNSTTTTNPNNTDLMENNSIETSQSSTIDPPLFMDIEPTQQQKSAPPSPLSNQNTVYAVNIEKKKSQKSAHSSSTNLKKDISATRKRPCSPEPSIALRLKRSKTKNMDLE
jgi:hypothetical protein